RFLFTALAGAVIISLGASYIVAMTVVPLYSSRLLSAHSSGGRFHMAFNNTFERMLSVYDWLIARALRTPRTVLATALIGFAASFLAYPLVGLAFFPRTDAGMFIINLKAPSGTRLELTDQEVDRVERLVREVIPKDELKMIVSNLGTTPDFSAIYST